MTARTTPNTSSTQLWRHSMGNSPLTTPSLLCTLALQHSEPSQGLYVCRYNRLPCSSFLLIINLFYIFFFQNDCIDFDVILYRLVFATCLLLHDLYCRSTTTAWSILLHVVLQQHSISRSNLHTTKARRHKITTSNIVPVISENI